MQRRRARIPRPVVTHGAALHSNLGNAQRASLRLLVGTGDEGEGLSLLVHTLVAISSYDYEAAGRRPAGTAGPPQPGPLVEQLDDPHDLGHVDQGLALSAVSRGGVQAGQALLDNVTRLSRVGSSSAATPATRFRRRRVL
jgi:hypothetical protein